MPAVSDGAWVDDIVDAVKFRKALGALVVPDAPASARPGRLPGPGDPLKVRPASPASRSVWVNAGKAVTERSLAYGPILGVGPDGDVEVPLGSAPATGTQWVRVYLLQRDVKAPASDAAGGAIVDMVKGAVGSQTKPALPAGAFLLGEVLDAAGAATITSSMVTDLPVWTNVRGGLLRVPSQAARDAAAYPTLTVLREDTGDVELCTTAGTWVTVYKATPAKAPTLPGVELLRTTAVGGNIALASGAVVDLTFGPATVSNDRGGFYTGSTTTIATVPAGHGGLYTIGVDAEFDGTGAPAAFQYNVHVNGARQYRVTYPDRVVSGSSRPVRLDAGDTISANVFQNIGTTRNLIRANLTLHLIGA